MSKEELQKIHGQVAQAYINASLTLAELKERQPLELKEARGERESARRNLIKIDIALRQAIDADNKQLADAVKKSESTNPGPVS